MVTTSSTSLTFFITLTTKLTERLINTALDDLEATGALQCSNCMDITELLRATTLQQRLALSLMCMMKTFLGW